MDLSPNFKKMMGMAEGLKTLPTSAAGPSQKPLPEGIGFDWKPSESETQRDIANAKALEPLERGAFMKARADELAKTEMRAQPKTQVEKENAFQSIMDSMLKPIEELGAATRRGFQKIMENQQQTQKALLAAGITPEKITDIGMAVLQTTPAGAAAKQATAFVNKFKQQAELIKFHADLKERVATKANLMREAVGTYLKEGIFQWKKGDIVLSPKTGKTYEISGHTVNPKTMEPLYRYKSGEEEGTFILDLAHESLQPLTKSKPQSNIDFLPKSSAQWAGEKISTALGDITATPSAKEAGKWQLTFWEGKAGTSNTVSDEVFNTAEEAQKALEKYKKLE